VRFSCAMQPSAPTKGMNRTSANSVMAYSSSATRVTRTNSCKCRSAPTGITRRPPILSCAFRDSGT
jgi:hypothetical protein